MPTAPTHTKVLALFEGEWYPATVESYFVLVKWEGESTHSLVAREDLKPHPTTERVDPSTRLATTSRQEGTEEPTIGGPERSCSPGSSTDPTIGGDQRHEMICSPGARVYSYVRHVEGTIDHWDGVHNAWGVVGPRNLLEADGEDDVLQPRQHLAVRDALVVRRQSHALSLMEQVTLNDGDGAFVELPWRVPCRPGWGGSYCPTLQSICALAPAYLHPFLHALTDLAMVKQQEPTPRLWDLPYNTLVKMVFTRAAISAAVHDALHPSHRMFSNEQLAEVLKAHDLDTVAGLGAALAKWMSLKEEPLLRELFNCKLSDAVLTVINRPGAWLLDCLHTEQLALVGADPAKFRTVEYSVVSNAALAELHDALMPHMFTPNMTAPPFRGLNYRGNQFEYLAWLALEEDKPQVALAIAWHARHLRQGVSQPWVWE